MKRVLKIGLKPLYLLGQQQGMTGSNSGSS